MKRLLLIIHVLLLLLASSCQKHAAISSKETTAESILTIQHINDLRAELPADSVIALIDSAQQAGSIAPWRADSMKASICLDSYYDLNKSIDYATHALSYDEVTNNPQRHLQMLVLTSQIEVSLGRYSECIRFSDEGYSLADQLKDNYSMARLMLNAGYSMYFMKEKSKGLDYMLRTQQMLKKMDTQEAQRTLSYCYGQMMNSLWTDNTDEAIQQGKMREALLETMETQAESPSPKYLDTQRGLTFSKMADFYALKKDFGEARLYEQKFRKTNLSQTARGNNLILDYYCTLGDFARAQQAYYKSLPYWEHKDTFCTRYASVLGMLADICHKEGLLQKALDYRSRQVRVKDSLLLRENENEAMRLSAVYQTHDKEIALEKKRADAQRYLIFAGAAIVLLLLALAFAFYSYRQQLLMLRKNKLLISQLDTINEYQQEIEKSQQPVKAEENNTDEQQKPSAASGQRRAALVQKFRQIIDEEKAYLQLDFSREKLQRLMDVSKNSLTPVLHEVLGDAANLSDYINSKRIAHACKLIREDPQMTIDNIAMNSGFSTTRNFRRYFKAQTGMSPAEYREAHLNTNPTDSE